LNIASIVARDETHTPIDCVNWKQTCRLAYFL